MILGDPGETAAATTPGARATLDDLFRRAAQRNPDTPALVDPPNRAQFTDGVARTLTYAQADRMISAIAERLDKLRLPIDAIVGIQLPNTVESVLALLGVLRAGLVAAPLPLLWRRSELVSGLSRIGAKALIGCRQVGATDHATLAMQTAADVFHIRYVGGFGTDLPEGVVPFDNLYHAENPQPPLLKRASAGNRAAHLALITWETTAESIVPVARSHAEIVSAGLAMLFEGRFENGATFLSTVPPTSFAGLATAVLPWLITGGTLMLHQPFDPETLVQQLREGCDAIVLPAAVAHRLLEADLFTSHVRTVIGLWRAPERMNRALQWPPSSTGFIDVACFGESCIVPMRRGDNGAVTPLPLGVVTAPLHATGRAVITAELARSATGTLTVSGPMVPRHAYPPGAARTELPHFKTKDGIVDTGHPCRINEQLRTLTLTGPPPGIAGVGGYRFALRDLQRVVSDIDHDSRIAALPDQLSGHRLTGAAADRAALRTALIRKGANPLVADAFA